MFNWLLNVADNGVSTNTISPDNIPDGYGSFVNQNNDFTNGLLLGIGISIGIWILVKLCKIVFIKTFHKNDNGESE